MDEGKQLELSTEEAIRRITLLVLIDLEYEPRILSLANYAHLTLSQSVMDAVIRKIQVEHPEALKRIELIHDIHDKMPCSYKRQGRFPDINLLLNEKTFPKLEKDKLLLPYLANLIRHVKPDAIEEKLIETLSLFNHESIKQIDCFDMYVDCFQNFWTNPSGNYKNQSVGLIKLDELLQGHGINVVTTGPLKGDILHEFTKTLYINFIDYLIQKSPKIAADNRVWILSKIAANFLKAHQNKAENEQLSELKQSFANLRTTLQKITGITDFSNLDLTNGLFSKGLYQHFDFSLSKLNNSDFSKGYLKHCNFNGSLLNICCFQNAVLKNVSFKNAQLSNVSFLRATLSDVDFSNAQLTDINWKYIKLAPNQLPKLDWNKYGPEILLQNLTCCLEETLLKKDLLILCDLILPKITTRKL